MWTLGGSTETRRQNLDFWTEVRLNQKFGKKRLELLKRLQNPPHTRKPEFYDRVFCLIGLKQKQKSRRIDAET